jgi:small subunit ribosomal protein S16
MIAIRLKKMGRKHIQQYRVVVEDSRYTAGGRVLDVIGHFSPKTDPYILKIDLEKLKQWVGKGAQMSSRIKSLLKLQKIS